MSDGSLFGLIHGLQDRSRARKVREAQRNFLTNPEAAIQEVNDYAPNVALNLRDYNEQRTQAQAQAEKKAEDADRERYTTAITGMTRALRGARDNPEADLGSAFDSLRPVFSNAFQMAPEEQEQWRQAILQDPSVLDRMEAAFLKPEGGKGPQIVSRGASLVGPDGSVLYHNPGAVRATKLRNEDGGETLVGYDDQGQPVSTGGSSSGSFAPRSANPQARGMRNQNPGNIKDGPWARRQPGYAGSDGTFARFDSMQAGEAAQETLLKNHYVNGQRSTRDIVMKYLGGADNPENSTASQRNYVDYVANRLGIDPSQPVPPDMLSPLAQAMREFENGGQQSGGASGVIARTKGKSDDGGWVDMSREEKVEAGLDPAKAYQRGTSGANRGRIQPVGGQPKASTNGVNKELTPAQRYSTRRALQKTIRQANKVINHPAFQQGTGPIQGRLPSIFGNTVEFDRELAALRGKVVVDALLSMKQNSPNGATGFGQLNMQEGKWIEYSEGAYDPAAPDALRDNTKELIKDARISLGMTYGAPPQAVEMLIDQPDLADAFNEKYGKGAAEAFLEIINAQSIRPV